MRRLVRKLLAAALVLAPVVWAQDNCVPNAPCYSAAGLVNSASGAVGAIAPHTFATLYGTNLSYGAQARSGSDALPGIGGVNVMVGGLVAMVFYVSPAQVNFLVPGALLAGPATLQLTRDGWAGPALTVTLPPFAPGLFCLMTDPQSVIAQMMPDYSLATADTPLHPGDYAILYATGLGTFAMPVGDYTPPSRAMQIAQRAEFQVLLDGAAVDDQLVEYVGSVVGYWGLIQINLKLPANVGHNPEIRLGVGGQTSRAGTHLIVSGQ